MMELIKQLYVRKKISFLSSIIVILGCSNKGAKEEPTLDCALRTYIVQLNEKIQNDDVIIVYDTQNWTDSTSIIRIIMTDETTEHLDYSTQFLGHSIYLKQRVLDSKNEFDNESAIKTNLEWNKVVNFNQIHETSQETLARNFFELQFTYSTKKKCVDDILLQPSVLKDFLLFNCKNCNVI